jgi:hypothetical protein
VIQNGAGQAIMLNEKHGVLERVCRSDVSSTVFEGHGNVHGDQGLIFDNEESETIKNRVMHKCSIGAAKRKEPEARGALWPLMSQAVDQSSNAQQAL